LRRTAAASAAMTAAATPTLAQSTPPPSAPLDSARGAERAATEERLAGGGEGCDFLVDPIKALGFDYVCANPGSSFRGLHESIINYGGNEKPELITCMHAARARATGHGSYQSEGKRVH